MVLPFLSREKDYGYGRVLDFESAYGYGGPVYSTADGGFRTRALQSFYEEMRAEGYLAGFVRFHPLLHNWRGFEAIGRELYDRPTVAIDLHGSDEEVWLREVNKKNRNVIKRSERAGLRFEADYSWQHLPRFVELYKATMARLGADDFYFFTPAYFEGLKDAVPGSFIGCVWQGDAIVAAAVFFNDGNYGHYHLAGSDASALQHSPNNLMLWHAALALKRGGAEWLHLGGGTDGREDNSLLLFKKRFAAGLQEFHIGKVIFDNDAYTRICAAWEADNAAKADQMRHMLLKYRY